VLGRVLGDTVRGMPDDVIRHTHRTATPALIGAFVDVTVITCEIAATVHLQHKLIEREEVPFHRGAELWLDGGLKCRDRHRGHR
jgi:hypothetical protein